jgi:hypothetical protein
VLVVVVVIGRGGGGGGQKRSNTNLWSGRASGLCFAEDGGDDVVPALCLVLVLQDQLVL